jgi:DNA-binding MltR family transcriptional regulator
MLVSIIKDKLKGIETELQAQTDRGAAIIGAAIVDDFLSDVPKKRLILTSTVSDRLFSHEANGPLASFAPKIDIAFAVGICDNNLRADLHDIRRIRNRFAHTPEALGFSDSQISEWCSKFRTADDVITSTDHRTLYIGLCSGASAYFAALAQSEIKLLDIRSVPEIREQVSKVFEQMMDKALKQLEPFLKPDTSP